VDRATESTRGREALPAAGPCLLAALALVALVAAANRARPPAAGEPAALRWARTAASHPWRSGLAVFLLLRGVLPPRRPVGAPTEARTGPAEAAAPSNAAREPDQV
jgi:hypothetical protein